MALRVGHGILQAWLWAIQDGIQLLKAMKNQQQASEQELTAIKYMTTIQYDHQSHQICKSVMAHNCNIDIVYYQTGYKSENCNISTTCCLDSYDKSHIPHSQWTSTTVNCSKRPKKRQKDMIHSDWNDINICRVTQLTGTKCSDVRVHKQQRSPTRHSHY